jgi:hypothetical protein
MGGSPHERTGGRPTAYLASGLHPVEPGGGPTSRPSTSIQAWASGSRVLCGNPMTSSGSSPCPCRNRRRTSDFDRHCAPERGRDSARATLRPVDDGDGAAAATGGCRPSQSMTAGSLCRRRRSRTRTYQYQMRAPSAILRHGLSGRAALIPPPAAKTARGRHPGLGEGWATAIGLESGSEVSGGARRAPPTVGRRLRPPGAATARNFGHGPDEVKGRQS